MTRNSQKKKKRAYKQTQGGAAAAKGAASEELSRQKQWAAVLECTELVFQLIVVVSQETDGVVSEGEKLVKLSQIQWAKEWFEWLKRLGRLGAATVAEGEGLQIRLWSCGYNRAW